jgi:hypothetical protein
MKTMKNKEKIYIFAIENIFKNAKNHLDVKICSMELHNCGLIIQSLLMLKVWATPHE